MNKYAAMLRRQWEIADPTFVQSLDDPGPAGLTGGGEAPQGPQVHSAPSHGVAVPAHRQAWRQPAPVKETAYER